MNLNSQGFEAFLQTVISIPFANEVIYGIIEQKVSFCRFGYKKNAGVGLLPMDLCLGIVPWIIGFGSLIIQVTA